MTIKNNGVIGMTDVIISTTGNILVNGKKEFIINNIDPSSQFSYSIEIGTNILGISSITITYANNTPIQSVLITITVQPIPPTPFSLTLGGIIGYLTYTLLFLSVLTGAGVYHL